MFFETYRCGNFIPGEIEKMEKMDAVGLYDKQAEVYLSSRPKYPSEWFSMISALTPHHSLAWDVGTGNGQAAIGVAEFYEQVIATDVSESQISLSIPHPRVKYIHTQPSTSDDELIAMLGGEGVVDLVIVATAVHWFDLPRFYSIVKRVLRKPGGIIAVWAYRPPTIDDAPPSLELIVKRLYENSLPYWHRDFISLVLGEYKTLMFPFESVGLGSEGEPLMLEMKQEVSFEGFLTGLRTGSAVVTAKEQGVDLLNEEVIKELESAWGGIHVIRTLNFKTFMLVGKVPNQE
ncbi:hypothetical protein Sjap_026182 [Stephania japonica]|uniref:Methyltransferase type 11 domain-containing protein n=1 Tax=Stephania japonica TaxID=461633 RepID=A0AAP0HIM9_9MAGN